MYIGICMYGCTYVHQTIEYYYTQMWIHVYQGKNKNLMEFQISVFEREREKKETQKPSLQPQNSQNFSP